MPPLLKRAGAEAIGTFFLVLIGPGAVMVDASTGGGLGAVGIALAFMMVVFTMVSGLGQVSGAHINPAVTIAFWSLGRVRSREVAGYVVAQCVGAIAAALFLRWVLGDIGHLGATLPNVGVWPSFAIEAVFSLVLMLVILGVTTDSRNSRVAAGLAIGCTVGFCALLGNMTGSSMNPARSLGPALAGGLWIGHWIYWAAPITGMLAATRVHLWFAGPAGMSA